MFDFQEVLSEKYEWPVELKVPVDGGKSKTIKFTAVFKRLGKTESNAMLESAREIDEDNQTVVVRYKIVFDEVLLDLKAKNDQGKTETLPDDIREELLEVYGVDSAIFLAYSASVSGEKVKN